MAQRATWLRRNLPEFGDFVLTLPNKVPIVRPPFGKSIDFLEQIPSKFSDFSQSRPAAGSLELASRLQQPAIAAVLTGTILRPLPKRDCPDETSLSPRSSLSAFLMTASGCCCGLFHGCDSCGYPAHLRQLRLRSAALFKLWQLWQLRLSAGLCGSRSLSDLPERRMWRPGTRDAAGCLLRRQLQHEPAAQTSHVGSARPRPSPPSTWRTY